MSPTVTPTAIQTTATPMMRQYLELKERYPDTILFFHLGDFCEMPTRRPGRSVPRRVMGLA